MGLKEAREHLDLANAQWEKASSAWWEPADPASCVTNAFYAYENLIVAVAEAHGRKWERNHYKKAVLAEQLFKETILSKDVSAIILRMNDLRKDVSYGEPGEQLLEADLEDIVSELEHFKEEVEDLVEELELEAENAEHDGHEQ